MFSHYLKTALRNIRNNWVYSILSICCLAIGTAMFSAFFYGINYEYYKYNRRPLYNRSAIVYEDMPGNDGYNTNRSYVMNGYHMPVSFEIHEGDACLVVFADRDIDAWFETGEPEIPPSGRMHSLSDGFAFVGF